MDCCMWAILYLSEQGETFKIILVNHQNHRSQTVIWTVQARLQDLTNVAAEICEMSSWPKWQTESWKNLVSVGVTKRTYIENRRTCILRLCIVCGK